MWLLDAFTKNDGSVAFTLYNEEDRTVEERQASLYFYGYIVAKSPQAVAMELESLNGVEGAWVEEWRAPPYYTNTASVVVFKTKNYGLLERLIKTSALRGLQIVNTFPHPLVEALRRAEIRPLLKLRGWRRGLPVMAPWDFSDEDPAISYATISYESGYYVLETVSERELFWDLGDLASSVLSGRFCLGFSDPHIFIKLVELEPRVASSVYRWITGGPFNPSEYFMWSRLSYTPLSLMNNVTIGRVLTTLEALVARGKRFIVDKSHGREEPWRSMRDLLVNDRGGVVYQPKPGLYWNVCQVDFKSLYPSIIVKYNVSGETVDRRPCNNELELPWTPHRVCADEEGVVPASIKELLNAKELYEFLAKKTKLPLYEHRRRAVKWILVASFGYLGYRNSLFGSIMAHEVVTSTSREVLKRARVIAERYGYRVIHAIVDSVFIVGVKAKEDCECIREKIEEGTGFKAKVEAHYKWLYIPHCVEGLGGASNKYYGLISDGSRKIKGILAIRRDTPLLVKRAQLEALEKLFAAELPEEMRAKLEEAHRVIDSYAKLLERGTVDPKMLVVSRGNGERDYKRPPNYALESAPPFRLLYASSRLVPFSGEILGNVDTYEYIDLLEKARGELPLREEVDAARH
ncbi:MAG: DNA polymerase domain-containing protein [Desulfurococcaceae archaeon]